MRALVGISLGFGMLAGAFCITRLGLVAGGVLGLFCGLVFAAATYAFAIYQSRRFHGQWQLSKGETLLLQDIANHVVGWEEVCGRLYLTSSRLHFRSHRFSRNNHEFSVPLGDIRKTEQGSIAGFVSEGLSIKTCRGTERFIVPAPGHWIDAVGQAKSD